MAKIAGSLAHDDKSAGLEEVMNTLRELQRQQEEMKTELHKQQEEMKTELQKQQEKIQKLQKQLSEQERKQSTETDQKINSLLTDLLKFQTKLTGSIWKVGR